ncbi:hypothetical protein C8J57DRAFT_50039 [Mycena rebaudengoi]|nr:hypothetical protein C8J57DRAFT_50039 [Mycena rebaudengoi]
MHTQMKARTQMCYALLVIAFLTKLQPTLIPPCRRRRCLHLLPIHLAQKRNQYIPLRLYHRSESGLPSSTARTASKYAARSRLWYGTGRKPARMSQASPIVSELPSNATLWCATAVVRVAHGGQRKLARGRLTLLVEVFEPLLQLVLHPKELCDV